MCCWDIDAGITVLFDDFDGALRLNLALCVVGIVCILSANLTA